MPNTSPNIVTVDTAEDVIPEQDYTTIYLESPVFNGVGDVQIEAQYDGAPKTTTVRKMAMSAVIQGQVDPQTGRDAGSEEQKKAAYDLFRKLQLFQELTEDDKQSIVDAAYRNLTTLGAGQVVEAVGNV